MPSYFQTLLPNPIFFALEFAQYYSAACATVCVRALVAKAFTGQEGVFTPLSDTIESFEKLCDGELDTIPEQAFLNVGGLDSVLEKAAKLERGEI